MVGNSDLYPCKHYHFVLYLFGTCIMFIFFVLGRRMSINFILREAELS